MTIIYFFLVLGITVFIHELGHFIFAKRSGVYVYEFAIGMGPVLFKKNRKNDETLYTIRAFPIGGYVKMSGEEIDIDEESDIPKEKQIQSKTWLQRFLIVVAGVLFNFILAIIILFIVGLSNGVPNNKPVIIVNDSKYPAYKVGLETGDTITKINNKKVNTTDRLMLQLQLNVGKKIIMEVKKDDGLVKKVGITPVKEKVDNKEVYKYGFALDNSIEHGIIPSIKYAFTKTISIVDQMLLIIGYLITGQLGLNSLAGPVGIFNIVGETAKAGIINLIYLVGFLSINVGFINLLPIPAFDGGRLLFLIIEKLRGKPINARIENIIHSVGFVLLMLLVVVITYNDIIRLLK